MERPCDGSGDAPDDGRRHDTDGERGGAIDAAPDLPEPPNRLTTRLALALMSPAARWWARIRTAMRLAFLLLVAETTLMALADVRDAMAIHGAGFDLVIRGEVYGSFAGAALLRPLLTHGDLADIDSRVCTDSGWGLLLLTLLVAECTAMRRGAAGDGRSKRRRARFTRCLATVATVLLISATVGRLGAAAGESYLPLALPARMCLTLIVLYLAVQTAWRIAYAVVERSPAWPAHLYLCGNIVLAVSYGCGRMLWHAHGVLEALPTAAAMTAIVCLLLRIDSRLGPYEPETSFSLARWLGLDRG
ncbi:hypothetical protein JS528_10780 [Bifidobacterium sp. MA2]|uniref:DUF418 domain-containing protein n=1 Tax=Bifidobacterium santillanense TaxID=2809028 RepID=A0ABS5US11_9BIFI|nr:hypothetical protein [Bifidobacterium santillanense]MBT1173808.1 hypothetical protein [Bifidobacterium santillanense]